MIDEARRGELGAFLRARRAELDPADLGVDDGGGRRRVSGLRREEVARLASISSDYYTRLEQGRRRASEPVLESLARVLRLDDAERTYLFGLSGRDSATPVETTLTVQPQLRRLLDDLGRTPGVVLGRRTDVLAWNPSAAALFRDFAEIPAERRNFVRLIFTDRAVRSLYADWPGYARATVGQLRQEALRDPDDPRLQELVVELSAVDVDFRRWWGDHRVGFQGAGRKVFRHPRVGELVLDWSALNSAADPVQQLVVFTAEPGSPSADRLRRLAGLAD